MDAAQRIGELEDAVKLKDKRIEELKLELDEQRALVAEMEEHIRADEEYLENFIHTFGLEKTDDNCWSNGPFITEHNALVEKYSGLLDKHNKLVRRWNANVAVVQPVGRPLAASEAQCAQVLKLRKGGASLSEIADATNLGLRTIRTIIGRADGTDRTTMKHRLRVDPEARVKDPRQRSRKALPRQATEHFEKGRELLNAAKGLAQ